MKRFKISIKDLIFLIILSAPIASFLILKNYKKINYEVMAKRGFAVTENLCENYSFEKIYLQKDAEIDMIVRKNKSSDQDVNSIYNSQVKVLAKNDSDIYLITIKGLVGQEEYLAEVGNNILDDISNSEILKFNNFYKDLKLHCKAGEFPVFKAVPLEKINVKFPVVQLYKNSHLFFLLMLPFFTFYLLLISYKYIIILIKNDSK